MQNWSRNIAGFQIFLLLVLPCKATTSPEEIVKRVNDKFAKIRDAQVDITLDTKLQILGCGGFVQKKGMLFFKAPDKIKIILDHDQYFIRGNNIRKIDREHKRYYIRLIHAPDFSPGFTPNLISHNFNLKLVRESTEEIVIEGTPKPGVLKNVKKVFFRIDPEEYLLLGMDLSIRQGLSGKVVIKYEKIGGINVPVATSGKSALELNSGFLAGFFFSLRGENVKVNLGLPDRLFDPGF